MRRWELVAGGSAKFWEVDQDGVRVTVRFGRLGAAGQAQTKELPSEAAARAQVAKLVAEKEKKGYVSVTTATTTATPDPAPTATPDRATAATPERAAATPDSTPVVEPVDEDAWVLPAEWLRQAMRRRDVHPLPEFAVDPAQAQEVRDRITAHAETITEVLAHPDSHPDLVRALRDHLDGRPDPMGAAALAKVAHHPDSSPAHWWIEEFGLPFAAAAAVHHSEVHVHRIMDRPTGQWHGNSLRWYPPRHYGDDTTSGRPLIDVRTALAVADQSTYDAALAELEKLGGDAFSLAARAFLAPTRHDWFTEANAAEHAPFWMVVCAASTLEHLRDLRVGPLTWSPVGVSTALHVHGPALAPVLDGVLRAKVDWGDDSRKLALKALAVLPTDEAFLLLLNRLRERYARSALLAAVAAFPARAARLLASRAAGDADVRNLLRHHLLTHPDLVLPEGVTPPESVPDAPADALPRVLAEPPWEHRRPQPAPVVLTDVPAPAAHLTWLPGEREQWLELKGRWTRDDDDWNQDAASYRAGRYHGHALFEMGPAELVRPLLAGWTPHGWESERWGRRVAARFELDALPAMTHLAVDNPQVRGDLLLPYATTEVAELMADWLARLKTARAIAVSWLSRHREAAVRLLLPRALGAAGPARRNAESALRHLRSETGVDVVAVATSVSAEAGAAVGALLDVDPLHVLPARLPVLADWADPGPLPQVLLADGAGALSARAVANLLMTAALSKPDAVYPGLPLAVEACDRTSLAEFAWALFGRWQDVGAPAKDGWVLTALGRLGDDETVRRLAPLIRAWPGESQHARAVTGLDVLAQIGSEVALAHLNGIAERVKFKGLKARAEQKVSDIAAALGLSRDQLSDRLVPRLGLDDAATSVIDYGPRRFTVGFDEQLKPYVLDPDGKRRKDLPKPGAKDDPELAPAEHKRFAALKKDVRAIASDQIHRLERAMVDQRTWTAAEFHSVLAAHPLLWHLVRRLVWLTDTGLSFRLAEDRTLADSADDEVALPGDAVVRVAHPVDLRDTAAAWGQILADYEILQPFPQLGRPVHLLAADELLPRLGEYRATPYPVGRILGLTKKGWVRGTPQDAGVECWITRPFPGGGALVASLDPGIAVGAVDVFPEVGFSDLWISPSGHGEWSAPRDAPATYGIDPITLSEILAELESLRS